MVSDKQKLAKKVNRAKVRLKHNTGNKKDYEFLVANGPKVFQRAILSNNNVEEERDENDEIEVIPKIGQVVVPDVLNFLEVKNEILKQVEDVVVANKFLIKIGTDKSNCAMLNDEKNRATSWIAYNINKMNQAQDGDLTQDTGKRRLKIIPKNKYVLKRLPKLAELQNCSFLATMIGHDHDNHFIYAEYLFYDTSLHRFIMQEAEGKGQGDLYNMSLENTLSKQLLSAVDFLHTSNIAHRNLTKNNVMVYKQGTLISIKITDYEFMKVTNNSDSDNSGNESEDSYLHTRQKLTVISDDIKDSYENDRDAVKQLIKFIYTKNPGELSNTVGTHTDFYIILQNFISSNNTLRLLMNHVLFDSIDTVFKKFNDVFLKYGRVDCVALKSSVKWPKMIKFVNAVVGDGPWTRKFGQDEENIIAAISVQSRPICINYTKGETMAFLRSMNILMKHYYENPFSAIFVTLSSPIKEIVAAFPNIRLELENILPLHITKT